MRPTPVTDRLEARLESEGRRDVPVRVYHQMRAFESDRLGLMDALASVLDGTRGAVAVAERLLRELDGKPEPVLPVVPNTERVN